MDNLKKLFLPAGILLLLCACSPTRLTGIWTDTAFRGPLRRPLLIVGVSEKPNDRRNFELGMTAAFKARGIDARPSAAVLPFGAALTGEELTRRARELNMGTMLIGHRVGAEETSVYHPPMSLPATSAQNRLGPYLSSLYDVIPQPGYYVQQKSVRIETTLYDVATEKRIWSTVSETVNPESSGALIETIGNAVVNALRDAGLL